MNKSELFNRKLIFDDLPDLFYSPEILQETREKIEIIREFLESNPEYNYILYFNHISFNDPLLVVNMADRIDPKHRRNLVAIMSYSHTDPDNPKHRVFSFMAGKLKNCGIEGVRVIQRYQVGNPEFGYTDEQARLNYIQTMRRIKEMRGTPTGVIISPEGHRSDTGQLMKGETGVVAIGRLLAPVIYIPLAISYAGNYSRDALNVGRKMRLVIGEVSVQKNGGEYPSVDQLMKSLAKALPEEMRGKWKSEVEPDCS